MLQVQLVQEPQDLFPTLRLLTIISQAMPVRKMCLDTNQLLHTILPAILLKLSRVCQQALPTRILQVTHQMCQAKHTRMLAFSRCMVGVVAATQPPEAAALCR